jgi:hypothetical protein
MRNSGAMGIMDPLSDQIIAKIGQAVELYHRLILVIAPSGVGKTNALQEVQKRTSTPLINVNLELSRRMLDLTERQRALQLPRLLGDIVASASGEAVLLDNIEILFDPSLKQDPLRLLQGLSRNKTIIAAWNGIFSLTETGSFRRLPKDTTCFRKPASPLS